ncbi:Putative voltage-gated potassium channel [Modestobacter italicus]|uniref:Voltage-gated potassium channel n=1 Tax=Modestobacter italicus (strain DSM 44449 / CECT 9708 / BC 501) TaxID=2732864 RepID=I4EXV4_MODI5|nr:potassium channel family protein [Modestobacter marinus]CCH88217.1 Putative voltage-gated potassium channel [Modestobacter marinus]
MLNADPDPSAAAAGRGRKRHPLLGALLRTTVTVVAIVVLYYLLPLQHGFGLRTALFLLGGLVVVGVIVTWQVLRILDSPHPALRAVEALALSLTLFLVLFAAAYVVLVGGDPAAFTQRLDRTDVLYFVVTVFTTVGFGDIAPVSQAARVITTLQMVGDLVLLGLVLRVVVNAVQLSRQRVGTTGLPLGTRPPSGPSG